MKISIIIPVYNVAPYIEECLHSVMVQSWQDNLECILVDDCGTDKSMQLIEERLQTYRGKIDFRIIRHQHNRGLSAARNSGIDAATGDYVFFLDSDDEITSDCIERLVKPLSEHFYDLVVADYRIVGDGRPKSPLSLVDGQVLKGREVLRAYRYHQWYMLSVNKLCKVDFLRQHDLLFREGIIHEDELWSFQVACLAQSLYVVRAETYIYKIRSGSITVTKNQEQRCMCLTEILYQMREFAIREQLYNDSDVHDIIQNFRIISLYSISQEAPNLLADFYVSQRRKSGFCWIHSLAVNGTNLRKQLRDLHQALPLPLALMYLQLLLRHLPEAADNHNRS